MRDSADGSYAMALGASGNVFYHRQDPKKLGFWLVGDSFV